MLILLPTALRAKQFPSSLNWSSTLPITPARQSRQGYSSYKVLQGVQPLPFCNATLTEKVPSFVYLFTPLS